MKNVFYLFILMFLLSCSDDDSNQQTFESLCDTVWIYQSPKTDTGGYQELNILFVDETTVNYQNLFYDEDGEQKVKDDIYGQYNYSKPELSIDFGSNYCNALIKPFPCPINTMVNGEKFTLKSEDDEAQFKFEEFFGGNDCN
mgnify:CR=1 FL=1